MPTTSPTSKKQNRVETPVCSDVILGPSLVDTLRKTLSTLHKNHQQLGIYTSGGKLAQVVVDERNNARIEPLTPDSVNVKLISCIRFRKRTRKGLLEVAPPARLAQTILAMTGDEFTRAIGYQGTGPLFPALESLRTIPLLQADGSLVTTNGYHSESRIFFHVPPTLQNITIPETVTEPDLTEAVKLLKDILSGFRFEDEDSKANAFGALLTAVVRNLIPGGVPLFVISATAPGTGKTQLALVILTTLLGDQYGANSAPNDDPEWRKSISAALLAGTPAILYDNVTTLDSSELAKLLTAPVWNDRLLGSSRQISLPVRAFLLATGNNVKLGADLARRCFWSKLEAKIANPYLYTEFRHSDLTGYVLAHRAQILSALFTLTKGWTQAGWPPGRKITFAGYQDWASVINGILSHAGIHGFLANHEQIVQQVSDEDAQAESFLRLIFQEHPEPFTVAEFHPYRGFQSLTLEDVNAGDDGPPPFLLADYLPSYLLDFTHDHDKFAKRLGQFFKRIEKRRFGSDNICVTRAGHRRHAVLWQVRFDSKDRPPTESSDV